MEQNGKLALLAKRDSKVQKLSEIKRVINKMSSDGKSLRPSTMLKIMKLASDNGINLDDSPEIQACVSSLLNSFADRQEAYSPNTVKQLTYNFAVFSRYCTDQALNSLPAEPATVESFLEYHSSRCHRNTLKSYVWSISKMHRVTGMPNPCDDEYVKLRLRAISRSKVAAGETISQAVGFNDVDLDHVIAKLGEPQSVIEHRDRLILALAYETMARSMEIATIKIEDIELRPDGAGVLNIPFSKANKVGKKDFRYLSPETVGFLASYCREAGIELPSKRLTKSARKAYLFVPCVKGGARRKVVDGKHIDRKTVYKVFKRYSAVVGKVLSGHSGRVGAAQDMLRDNVTLPAIQKAGGWSSPEMPARYAQGADLADGAMARRRGHRGVV